MNEITEDTRYDDTYSPVEMSTTVGLYKGVGATFYQIALAAGFDDEIDAVLLDFGLDTAGYTLESVILKFLETENPELLDAIVGLDSESATCVLFVDTAENQHQLAKEIYRFCGSPELFKETVDANLDFIREHGRAE